jgi:ATP/maltotriose-dependent transcriptional regulator MalT
VAEAVYDDILPSERVRLHVACAEALERDATLADGGAALATMLAHHWYAAHDVTRALSASIEAARHASAAYAYAEAAQHLERALSTWPRVVDPEAQAGLDLVDLLQLASAAVARVGDVHRAVALLDQALSLVDREREPVRAALLLARRGRPQRDVFAPSALEDLQAAAALLPADAPERADVLGSLSAAALVGPGDFEMARQAAAEAVEVARALGQTRQAADALATLGPALLALGHREDAIAALEEGLRLATEAGDEHIQLRAHVNLSDVLGTLGRLEESAAVARRGTELAKEFGLSRTWGILLTANLAEALVTSGDWDEAAAALDEALSIAVAGPPEEWLLEMAAELALGRGELDEAARHLGASSDHGSDQLALGRAMLLAEQARCEGRLLDSRALLSASLDDRTFENQYTWPQVWLAMRVEADLAQAASADVVRVVALVDSLAAVPIDAAPLRSYVALARGEQARATGEPQAAAWTEAVAAVREAGDLYRLAYAQRRLGEALATDGDRQSAGEALGEAAAIAGRLGARPLLEEIRSVAQRARLEVPAGGEPAPVSDLDRFGLTSREIEVLRLVAEGRSNGEIAGALFISPKTASVHVSNILGKLSVASRGEAAAVAHRLRLFD